MSQVIHIKGVDNEADFLSKPFTSTEHLRQFNRLCEEIDWEDDRPVEDFSKFTSKTGTLKKEKRIE